MLTVNTRSNAIQIGMESMMPFLHLCLQTVFVIDNDVNKTSDCTINSSIYIYNYSFIAQYL